MDMVSNYVDVELIQVLKKELEDKIKECKSEEEKDKVIREYFFKRVLPLVVIIVVLFLGLITLIILFLFLGIR